MTSMAAEPVRIDDPADPRIEDRISALVLEHLEEARRAERTDEGFVVHRPVGEGIRVDRDDDGSFVVVGRQAERAVNLSDLTNLDALDYAQARLKRLGVPKALARAGAQPGDTVRIGRMTFDYEPDE